MMPTIVLIGLLKNIFMQFKIDTILNKFFFGKIIIFRALSTKPSFIITCITQIKIVNVKINTIAIHKTSLKKSFDKRFLCFNNKKQAKKINHACIKI